MAFIENTFNDFNIKTIPEVIKNRLYKLAEVDIYNPYVDLLTSAFIPIVDYFDLLKKIEEGLIDNNGILYNLENYDSIFELYTIGFQKGILNLQKK
jgi:hypothetical protein